MKVIIAGGRDVTDYKHVKAAVSSSGFDISEVVSGCARGADTLGEQWAKLNSVSIKRFHANWDLHGKRAGPLRNIEMGNYADALIALWDGESRGTKHMIDYATKQGLKIFVYRVDQA